MCETWTPAVLTPITIVLPAMAEHLLATCSVAELSWYDGVGHTPFLEQPERFNRELAALTRRVNS